MLASPNYLKRIRENYIKYDIFTILGEVMCGMERTSEFFAFWSQGIQLIKELLCQRDILNAIRISLGSFKHGRKYMGYPIL